jgi:hypothetical protein
MTGGASHVVRPSHGAPEFSRLSAAAVRTALTLVRRTFLTSLRTLSPPQRAWLSMEVRSLAQKVYSEQRAELLRLVSSTPGVYDGFKVVESSSGESLSLAVLRDSHPSAYVDLLDEWSRAHPAAWADAYSPSEARVRVELPSRSGEDSRRSGGPSNA